MQRLAGIDGAGGERDKSAKMKIAVSVANRRHADAAERPVKVNLVAQALLREEDVLWLSGRSRLFLLLRSARNPIGSKLLLNRP